MKAHSNSVKNCNLDPNLIQIRDGLPRRPLFSALSLLAMPVLAFGSIPYWRWSVAHQTAAAQEIYSPDPGQFGGFAVLIGALMTGAIGALVGLVLAFIARGRRERWPWIRGSSFFINAVGVLFGGYLLFRMSTN